MTRETVTATLIIAVAMVLICLGMTGCWAYDTKKFVEHGYCQDSVKGQTQFVWQKCGDVK